MVGALLVHHGHVDVRIEIRAEHVHRRDALLAQQLMELAVDQLDALAVGAAFVAADRERAIEIVDHQQELLQDVDDRLVALLAPLALDPLAVVVELGALAEPAILEVVALALQVGKLGVFGRRDRGVRSVVHRFISHMD